MYFVTSNVNFAHVKRVMRTRDTRDNTHRCFVFRRSTSIFFIHPYTALPLGTTTHMIEKHFGKCAYLKMKMLDLEEVEKIKDIGEWSYSGCDKALAFWNAYEWRLLFLKTEEYGYIKEIVRESINKSWILLHQNILIPYFSACNTS